MIFVACRHDRVGAGERGAGRQLEHRDQVALVLGGMKPVGARWNCQPVSPISPT